MAPLARWSLLQRLRFREWGTRYPRAWLLLPWLAALLAVLAVLAAFTLVPRVEGAEAAAAPALAPLLVALRARQPAHPLPLTLSPSRGEWATGGRCRDG